ncbi:MAG: hypothetical protein Q6363_007620, partial [Candidatus Njordarchaeota archaeon]
IMEAEAIICNKLVEMFWDDINELEKIGSDVNGSAREAIKHALIRIIQERENKRFYEIKIDHLDDKIKRDIVDTLDRKKNLRNKINRMLRKEFMNTK